MKILATFIGIKDIIDWFYLEKVSEISIESVEDNIQFLPRSKTFIESYVKSQGNYYNEYEFITVVVDYTPDREVLIIDTSDCVKYIIKRIGKR